MGFNFIIEDDDEETLDLSDLYEEDEKPKGTFTHKGMIYEGVGSDKVKVSGFELEFTEEVPEARTLSDPEVRTKAQQARSNRPGSYADKVAAGWSYCCAHKRHLPNLCEREQDRGIFICYCPCHEARGYQRPQPESLRGSDDEDEVLILD